MAATIMQMEGSIVAPKDDAVMHEIFNEQAGVVRGCALTYMGTNQIKVGAGYIYACGRLIKIEEETVLSPFAADENGAEGELILKIDLLSDTPAKYIARTPRQELVQEDINGDGAVYEYLIASYTVTDVAISGLTIEYEVISAGFSKDKILTTLAEVEATTEPGFLPDALVVKELNSKMLRYNAETDMIQIFFDGTWKDWKLAGMQKYYLFKSGSGFINGSVNVIAYNSGCTISKDINTDYIKITSNNWIQAVFTEELSKFVGEGKSVYMDFQPNTMSITSTENNCANGACNNANPSTGIINISGVNTEHNKTGIRQTISVSIDDYFSSDRPYFAFRNVWLSPFKIYNVYIA